MLRGLEAIAAFPSVRPIKVNAVAMRDFTEREAVALRRARPLDRLPGPLHRVHAARRRPRLDARAGADRGGAAALIDAIHPLRRCRASPTPPRASSASPTARGEIGFVNPVSEPFCADCNRIRLTAEGKLRTCLFSIHETDLREPLRAGAADAELERIIRDAVWRKELKHRVNEPGFTPPARTMSAIGG